MESVFGMLEWCYAEREGGGLCYSRADFAHPGSVLESSEELFKNSHTWAQS